MARRRFPFLLKFALATAAIAVVAFFTRDFWLPVAGYALIHSDAPAKADIAVVLAGDPQGHRIEKAAHVAKAGYVSQVLVSGPPGVYGINESDLAVQFIEHEGFPAQWFIPFPDPSHSTREESGYVLRELRRRNVHSFLLVTSDYHSGARANLSRHRTRTGLRAAISDGDRSRRILPRRFLVAES